MGVPVHACPGTDDDGMPLAPDWAQCGTCHRAWCFRCEPTPAALCPWCHGTGASSAPIPPRQLRKLRKLQASR